MSRAIWIALAFAVACGGKQTPPPEPQSTAPPPPVKDTRSAFEQRRDAACEHLAPKLTHCAVEDAQADFAAGKISKQQLASDTAPEVQRKNTQVFIDKCHAWRDMSSRQVRVLEVCDREETQCGPLSECLKNLQAQK